MPLVTGSPLLRLRAALVAQAVLTGGLSFGPLGVDRWLPFVAGIAAGSLLLAWFVGTATRSAWLMTLAFEGLAIAVGATGAANGEYVPGTLLAVGVIALLVAPSGRELFRTTPQPAFAAPVRLTPPPVVAAVPRTAPPAFPPPPPVPVITPPPPPPLVVGGFSGTILPGR